MKVGFIGLGIMGLPMSINLCKAGYDLVVLDRNTTQVNKLLAAGATAANSPREVAEQADLVITMLPNSPQVKEVLLGEAGLIEGLKSGATVIDMSSISPIVSQELAGALAEKEVYFLDAPVSGGEPKAIDATLSVMVGGDETIFEQYRSLLQSMAGSVVYTGKVGAGNITKLANQVIVAVNIAAMSEALTLATKAGVDPELVFNAIRGGLAGSTVLEAKGSMVLERNFDPGFRIDLHIKDLNNAVEAAAGSDAPLPLSNTVLQMMNQLSSEGLGNADHSAIVKHYEKVAGVTVKPYPSLAEAEV